MIYDLQKASALKRISAFLLDIIVFVIIATGVAGLISNIVGYDNHLEKFESIKNEYAEEYGIDLDISDEDRAKLSDEEKAKFEAADKAFSQDEEAIRLYQTIMSLILLIISLSPFFGCLVVDFVIPLFLRNGQTLGKKVFGIGVMMVNGVRITTPALFVRAILGKYVIETAVPIIMIVMLLFGLGDGFIMLSIVLGIAAVNLAFLCVNKKRSLIHDYLSYTVCVDMASQMIFGSVEELEAYKARVNSERAEDR